MELLRQQSEDGRVRRLVVTPDASGWEVREEEDSAVVRRVHRADWHRVERERRLFEARLRPREYQGDEPR